MAVATHLKIDIEEYDTRIRTFIPYYEEMLDAAVEALPAAGRTIETVVDLGAGTGALSARVSRALPRARIVGIDADEGMLAMAGQRLPARRTTLVKANFIRAGLPQCDAVTASFACNAVTRRSLCAGLVRANTETSRTTSFRRTSSIRSIACPVIVFGSGASSSSRAIASAVAA